MPQAFSSMQSWQMLKPQRQLQLNPGFRRQQQHSNSRLRRRGREASGVVGSSLVIGSPVPSPERRRLAREGAIIDKGWGMVVGYQVDTPKLSLPVGEQVPAVSVAP